MDTAHRAAPLWSQGTQNHPAAPREGAYLAAVLVGCPQGDTRCHSSHTGRSGKGPLRCATWEGRAELGVLGSPAPTQDPRGVVSLVPLGLGNPRGVFPSSSTTRGTRGVEGVAPRPRDVSPDPKMAPVASAPRAPMGALLPAQLLGASREPTRRQSSPGRGFAVEAGPQDVPLGAPRRQQAVHVDLLGHHPSSPPPPGSSPFPSLPPLCPPHGFRAPYSGPGTPTEGQGLGDTHVTPRRWPTTRNPAPPQPHLLLGPSLQHGGQDGELEDRRPSLVLDGHTAQIRAVQAPGETQEQVRDVSKLTPGPLPPHTRRPGRAPAPTLGC